MELALQAHLQSMANFKANENFMGTVNFQLGSEKYLLHIQIIKGFQDIYL